MAEQAYPKFEQVVEKIEKIEKVDPSRSPIEISPAEDVSAAQKVKFDEAVSRVESKWDLANSSAAPKTTLVAAEDLVPKLSPIDQMSISSHRIERLKPVTVDQIVEQAEDLRSRIQAPIAQIQDVQKTQPDVRISGAHEALLTDKLIHVDSSIKTALNKVGVEVTASEIHQTMGQKPLVKFLNMLTNSDRQLYTLVGEINSLQGPKAHLTPEKLLAVQIKLGFVQQELEFFSNVLNQTLQGVKTVMNVQV